MSDILRCRLNEGWGRYEDEEAEREKERSDEVTLPGQVHLKYILYLADYRRGGRIRFFSAIDQRMELTMHPYPPQGLMHLKVVSGRSGCYAT